MADTVETITVRGDFITVPLLIWRRFHRPMPGLAEAILAINPGLAAAGPFIPIGTTLQMPIPAQDEAQNIAPKIKLW